jgi:outer membrane protein TolC
MPLMSDRVRARSVVAAVGIAGVFSPFIGGCNDFGPLDSEMYALTQERTSLINARETPPYRPPAETPGLADASLLSKQPPTLNPAGDQLSFKVAAESRDVAARLAAFQAIDTSAAIHMSLADSLAQAQQTGREHITAQEQYLLAAIALMIERHLWGPRFFADADVAFASRQVDGEVESSLALISQLRATQRLPYGGEVEARVVWEATDNLRNRVTEQYQQASFVALDASIPLMRGAGLYAQEDLIQAERDLIYAARDYELFRRDYLVSIASDYFDLIQQLTNIGSTETQLAGFKRIETQEQALYEAGRIPQLRVNNAANQVRQAEDSLANQKDRYTLTLDRFKVRLGIPVTTPVVIDPSELAIPEPDVTLDEAVELALQYRLDLQNRRDQLEDTRRRVKNAKNELLPDLDVAGNVTFPTDVDAREGGFVYEPDDVRYGASARLTVPLDKKIEKLNVRQAMILAQRGDRDLERFRDEVVLDVRSRVRAIDLARNSLQLSTERVELTKRRKEEQDIKRDEFTTQELLDAENDLLDAENSRAQAATNLRNAVLEYLLATGQLRVTREGQLERLPGMEAAAVP